MQHAIYNYTVIHTKYSGSNIQQASFSMDCPNQYLLLFVSLGEG